MKKDINEHDMTKKMLSTLRESKRNQLNEFKGAPSLNTDKPNGEYIESDADGIMGAIKNYQPMGQEEPQQSLNKMDDMGDESSDTIDPSQEEMNTEYSKFSEVVNPRVQFDIFKIYPEANNVILGGKFQGMSGLEWQFSLEDENGLYITVNNLQVDSDVLLVLQKLKGYYDNWADEWSKKLATEYKNKINKIF